MFYEDIVDMEDETFSRKKYNSELGTLYKLKQEKRFYKLYSGLMQCHAIVKNGQLYEHEVYDIKTMKPTERILKISYLDDIHFFDINSFMEVIIKDHSLILVDSNDKQIEIIPAQLRSMITDGAIT